MKFQRILSAVYATPLYLTPTGHQTIDAVLRPHLANGALPERTKGEAGTDIFGDQLPVMEIDDDVAVIPINGPLLQHAGMLDKMCGAASYDDIAGNVRTALSHDVRGIVLNFDSPGGQMTGCAECAKVISEAAERVPIYAFTDSLMASAAYHLAAGCTGIFSTGSANIGSIGCILGLMDTSARMEMAGVKPVYITSGPLKATGAQGTSLTPEQFDYLQGMVNSAADKFKAFVLNHRPSVPDSAMQGQVFYGDDALDNGLVDAVVDDLETVKGFFAS